MNFGLLMDRDKTRYCYLRLRSLEELLKDERVVNAVMARLAVPGKKNSLERLSLQDKVKAIDNQIQHFQKTPTSLWYGVEAAEVLAAAIWDCDLPNRIVLGAFGDVRKESMLVMPIARWLTDQGLEVYGEVPLGNNRVDLLGFRRPKLLSSERVVSIELKNDLEQLKRGLDQLATFRDYSTCVYLACTPALAAQYLQRHSEARNVRHWDPNVLARKLEPLGIGLLLVEGEHVFKHIAARERSIAEPFSRELRDTLQSLRPLPDTAA